MISNETPLSIPAIIDRHRALAVLRLLAGDDLRGSANEAVLSDILEMLALGGSRAAIRGSLNFLEKHGLLTASQSDPLMVVHLTRLGSEIARGTERMEGVQPFTVESPY